MCCPPIPFRMRPVGLKLVQFVQPIMTGPSTYSNVTGEGAASFPCTVEGNCCWWAESNWPSWHILTDYFIFAGYNSETQETYIPWVKINFSRKIFLQSVSFLGYYYATSSRLKGQDIIYEADNGYSKTQYAESGDDLENVVDFGVWTKSLTLKRTAIVGEHGGFLSWKNFKINALYKA